MPFTYRAITANCGNDFIGSSASAKISELISADKPDFFVINCQEVHFNKTLKQLKKDVAEKGYKVECLAQMKTHTKISEQFHARTGIATFVIYKTELTVKANQVTPARRASSRHQGSAYNKGGLITDFSLTRSLNEVTEQIQVQAISGHLDSHNPKKRSIDWHRLHKESAKDSVESWEELAVLYPHLRLSGYDANTRNTLDKAGKESNLLSESPDAPEVQILYRAPLAETNFSIAITYNKTGAESSADPKRAGYAARGMLDFVGIADGRINTESVTVKDVLEVGAEPSTKRDHHVLISPQQEYVVPDSAFNLVKAQIASRLCRIAPALTNEIMALTESSDSKKRLLDIHNTFLSKSEGIVHKAIAVHTQKLALLDKLLATPVNETLVKRATNTLFENGAVYEDAFQLDLMGTLVHALLQAPDDNGMTKRLDLYDEIHANKNADISAMFQKIAIDEYAALRQQFADTLIHASANHNKLIAIGNEVLHQMDLIRSNNDPDISQLSRVAMQCTKACEIISSQKIGENPQRVAEELNKLAQEVTDNKPSLWQKLGKALSALYKMLVSVIKCFAPHINTPEEPTTRTTTPVETNLSKKLMEYKVAYQKTCKSEKKNNSNDSERPKPFK